MHRFGLSLGPLAVVYIPMPRKKRIEEYRKRRHRSALRRRGHPFGRPSGSLNVVVDVWALPVGPQDVDRKLYSALGAVTKKACSYPGVAGVLYRPGAAEINLHIVALRPMAAPMKMLAATWSEELRAQTPGVTWSVGVSPTTPPNLHEYRCLFWRDP
ncbi:MAG: hypothetical protein Kow0092_09090 [Deferrisomatales bacterium]